MLTGTWGGENGKSTMWLEYPIYFNCLSYFSLFDRVVVSFHPYIKVPWKNTYPFPNKSK